MLEPLVKLSNFVQQHQSGLDVRWMMKVIEEPTSNKPSILSTSKPSSKRCTQR